MQNILAENMRRFGTKNLESSNHDLISNYINTIDSSLKIQEDAISKQLHLYKTMQDKIKFLEFVEQNYMQSFFRSNQTILKEFKQNYSAKILNESSLSLTDRIAKYFNFVKNSILFETNLFELETYSNRLNEQGVWDSIKSAGRSAYNAAAAGVKKVGQVATNVVKKGAQVVKGVWNKVMQSDLTWFIPGLNIAKLGYEVQKNWDKIKKMTLADWVEEFRNFLNGATGIAIQIVLALTGVGNLANMIAWGVMLTYDIAYQGFGQGNWNWYNILTSAIGLLGTGAAAAVFKPLQKVLAGIKEANALIPGLTRNPTVWKTVGGWITKIAKNGGVLVGKIGNALKWLISKIPGLKNVMQPLQQKLGSVKTLFDEWLHGIQAYTKKGVTQNMTTHGYTGSSKELAKGIGKKTAAVTDKIATKKGLGVLKQFHTVKAAGETLSKIVAKWKTTLDNVLRLNPNLAKNPKAQLPVNTKVRVS